MTWRNSIPRASSALQSDAPVEAGGRVDVEHPHRHAAVVAKAVLDARRHEHEGAGWGGDLDDGEVEARGVGRAREKLDVADLVALSGLYDYGLGCHAVILGASSLGC